MAGPHFRTITDLLFETTAATLSAFSSNAHWLGGKLAFSLVLHTWSQDLSRHLHVHAHALLTSGALTSYGHWIGSQPCFLFPVKTLSTVFRAKYIEALVTGRFAKSLL